METRFFVGRRAVEPGSVLEGRVIRGWSRAETGACGQARIRGRTYTPIVVKLEGLRGEEDRVSGVLITEDAP